MSNSLPKPGKYRADIDGLRAIAVMSVVFFHAFPSVLTGGFIGVDIFFIISGFLISGHIYEELAKGKFSFLDFYSRRIRRIYPALITVLLTVLVIGWFCMFTFELKILAKDAAASSVFLSNIVFWKTINYFDPTAGQRALLHLWSLGVEEQYYIVIPIVLSLLWRKTRLLFAVMAAVALISFGLNVILVKNDASMAFYLPMTRFWEMLMGGFLAWIQSSSVKTPWASEIFSRIRMSAGQEILARHFFSWFGVGLVVAGVLMIDESMRFPGWWALVPCLGAVFILGAGDKAWCNRILLSSKIPVYIGLISYPLYLWHWPMLVFAKLLSGGQPSTTTMALAVLLSAVLAALTYHLIEKPLRSIQFKVRFPGFQRALFCTLIAIGGVSFLFTKMQSIPERFAGSNQTIANVHEFVDDTACRQKAGVPGAFCRLTSYEKPLNAVLIGDSHAYHLLPGLERIYAGRPDSLMAVGSGNCVPFYDVNTVLYDRPKNCPDIFGPMIRRILSDTSTTTVMLSNYAVASISGDVNGDHMRYITLLDLQNQSTSRSDEIYLNGLRRTLRMLLAGGKKVVFFLDNPELDFDPVACLNRPMSLSGVSSCTESRDQVDRRFITSRPRIMQALKEFPQVLVVDPFASLCNAEVCSARSNGQILYQDRNHLSANGSNFLIGQSSEVLNRFLNR